MNRSRTSVFSKPLRLRLSIVRQAALVAAVAVASLVLTANAALAQAGNEQNRNERDLHPLTAALLRDIGNDRALICWIIDDHLKPEDRPDGVPSVIDRAFRELESRFANRGDQLLCVVVAAGIGTRFETEQPTNDWNLLRRAVRDISSDGNTVDNLFMAASLTATKYRPFETANKRKLIIVLLSDESGDDFDEADLTLAGLEQNKVRFHVVAPYAAFGKRIVHAVWVDPQTNFRFHLPTKRGPLTRRAEFVTLNREDLKLSAGFGPFQLAMLARRTGGTFVPFADGLLESPDYDPAILARYEPFYGTSNDYQDVELTSHRMDLVRVAEGISINSYFYHFRRWIPADERDSNIEQWRKDCARLLKAVETALPLSESAEKEWAGEPTPRWRANYDLSMARLLFTKVAAAELVQALADFQEDPPVLINPNNNGWNIEWSANLRVDPDRNRALVAKAQSHYDRVLKEHPGTPWHFCAQKETPALAGVRWKEGINPDYVRKEDWEARSQVKPPRL